MSGRVIKSCGRLLRKNLPTILAVGAGLSVIGAVSSAIMETPTALKRLEEAKEEKNEELTVAEQAMVVVPEYKNTIIFTLFCLVLISKGHKISAKRQAALMAAMLGYKSNYKNYRESVIKLHGKEMDEEIIDDVLAARTSCQYHCIDSDIPDRKMLFYDPISKRPFVRYEREVIDAEYHFNRNFTMRGCAALNELYEFLGLEPTEEGEALGWNMYSGISWVDFEHRLVKDALTGKNVYVLDMVFGPEEHFAEDFY